MGQFISGGVTLSNGNAAPLAIDSNARLIASRPLYIPNGSTNPIVDTPVAGAFPAISKLQLMNSTGAVAYLMVFLKPTALVTGDVPATGFALRVPANSTVGLYRGDLGEFGTIFGTNTRIGLSSTPATFTAISSTVGMALHYEVAV